jgi:hypothetical protein
MQQELGGYMNILQGDGQKGSKPSVNHCCRNFWNVGLSAGSLPCGELLCQVYNSPI